MVCALLCALLKSYEGALSLALGALGAALVLLAGMQMTEPILAFFDRLISFTSLPSAIFSPLLKALAIAVLSQIAAAFCQDAQQTALAKATELCGSILCLYAGLPLASMLLELLQTIGGG